MDAESQWIPSESPRSSADVAHVNGGSVHHSDLLEARCLLCRRIFFLDSDPNESTEPICVCGECNKDHDTDIQGSHHSRSHRRSRYNRSSESIEDLFSQQLSQLLNLVQNQHAFAISTSEHEGQVNNDAAFTVMQRSSSHTTPSRSRRWHGELSDNDSEGFDSVDSLFGESNSNISFGGFGALHGESDAVSFTVYGADSDASVEGHGIFDRELSIQPDDGSNIASDTDIDPMHAGLDHWNSNVGDEDGEWEEADVEDEPITESGRWVHYSNRSNGNGHHTNWRIQVRSAIHGASVQWRMQESTSTYIPDVFANLEDRELPPNAGNPSDYLDARGFDELLEQLAETDSARRGAPPAAASFVDSLPRIIICEEHQRHGYLICAVCKDHLHVDTEVNVLPCLHLYHPSCILPWLSTRNSCPVCRFELPTDDRDYEEGKQNSGGSRPHIHEIQQQDTSEDSSSDILVDVDVDEAHEYSHGRVPQGNSVDIDNTADVSNRERTRGWLFLAAAPIVGIVLVLCSRNPLVDGRIPCGLREQNQQFPRSSRTTSEAEGRENRRRRWSFF